MSDKPVMRVVRLPDDPELAPEATRKRQEQGTHFRKPRSGENYYGERDDLRQRPPKKALKRQEESTG